jgi:hypothetical protein
MNHEHDPDLERADWEGMLVRLAETEEDKIIADLLLSIKNEFWNNKKSLSVEEAASSLVEKMRGVELEEFKSLAERHFSAKTCILHDRNLICDERKLASGNSEESATSIANESLKEHLKWFLGEKEWALLEQESNKRILLEEKRQGGTPG